MVVTIPKEVVDEEGIKLGDTVNFDVRKVKRSYFGVARGVGPFTSCDEMKSHD